MLGGVERAAFLLSFLSFNREVAARPLGPLAAALRQVEEVAELRDEVERLRSKAAKREAKWQEAAQRAAMDRAAERGAAQAHIRCLAAAHVSRWLCSSGPMKLTRRWPMKTQGRRRINCPLSLFFASAQGTLSQSTLS